MNNQNTIEKMKQMRLKGMAEAHYNNLQSANYHDHTIDQYLALLIDQEWEFRQERKINTLSINYLFLQRLHLSYGDLIRLIGFSRYTYFQLKNPLLQNAISFDW